MDEKAERSGAIKQLKAFRRGFEEFGNAPRYSSYEYKIRETLQRSEPIITRLIISAVGDGVVTKGSQTWAYSHVLGTALLENNYSKLKDVAISLVNKAMGTIEAGLWPPKSVNPTLIIRDKQLHDRCGDLLRAANNYDRVVREATTVLEDRIRTKVPHEILSQTIPNSADQVGETLVNKLINPDKPILSVSGDKTRRVAFFKILTGVFSYLRNPYHHKLDDQTEWSWAWSVVGLVDQLLADIDSCSVLENGGGK